MKNRILFLFIAFLFFVKCKTNQEINKDDTDQKFVSHNQTNTLINKEPTIKINHFSINTDSIPMVSGLLLQKNTYDTMFSKNLIVESKIQVYKSPNSKNFIYSKTTTPIKNINKNEIFEQIGNTSIEFFDRQGKTKWEVNENMEIASCRISKNGNYTHIIWSDTYTFNGNNEIYKLVSYNKEGDIIKTVDNVNYFYSGNNVEKIFYLINLDQKTFKIGHIDYINKKEWSKIIVTNKAAIIATSYDERYSLLANGDKNYNHIYSYNYKGELRWKEKFEKVNGIYNLSYNGKYYIQVNSSGIYRIFNNENGKIINDNNLVNNETLNPIFGVFVDNTDVVALCKFVNKKETEIIFIDIEGKLMDKLVLDDRFIRKLYIIKSKPFNIDIYFDEIKRYSKKINF
jgi:hypothetical protein